MQRLLLLLFLLLSVTLTGCFQERAASEAKQTKPIFFAVVEPHAFLLEKIGGDRIHVEVLVPTGIEPENYEATPQKMAALAKSRAVFLTGMPCEKNLVPRLRLQTDTTTFVDLRDGLELRPLELHDHSADGHEDEHGHYAHEHHTEPDPHIWFALEILRKQAKTIYNTLVACDPEGKIDYGVNLTHFEYEIDNARVKIGRRLRPHKGETIFVFHPSYGYFCDEFGLKQRAIEFEGRDPKPQQLAELKALVERRERPPVIFVQPEFNESSARAIAEATGARTVRHSALQRDVLKSMSDFAEAIAAEAKNKETE